MERFFPADYRVIMPGADAPAPRTRAGRSSSCSIAEEERAALRMFLRALRTVPLELDWRATIWSARPLAAPATLGRRCATCPVRRRRANHRRQAAAPPT